MNTTRLEAFSDGVFAIIITIMVLDLKVPDGSSFQALESAWPVFLSYVLSFVMVGIYWNNHHHMLHLVRHVSGGILWANLHLLFWLSLVPFTTRWMGETHFSTLPVVLYGVDLLLAGGAYSLLSYLLIRREGEDSPLARALGRDFKGKISLLLYVVAISLASIDARIALALYVMVAAVWFCPDPRIERRLQE